MAEYYTPDKKCVVVVSSDKKSVSAWVDGGSISFYIRPSERDMFRFNPEQAVMFMQHKCIAGIYRCSKCGWEGKRDEFKYGHMAELQCVACIKDFIEQVENDKKTGNICRLCKKPRSICTC